MSRDAKNYLDSFINYEIHLKKISSSTFKLERMKQLLNLLDNPQAGLRIIHVAGSKGKGSTCALIAQVLKEAGYRVGLYTSPHIHNYKERIRILDSDLSHPRSSKDGGGGEVFPDAISEEQINQVLEQMKPAIEEIQRHPEFGELSFFEVYTALALSFFQKHKVDFVVLETGLGGRLDATNAASSLIAVITPISLEHTNILGLTVEEIAKEKAAIIKDFSQKVVIASQEANAKKILLERCAQFGIPPVVIGRDILYELVRQNLDGQMCSIRGKTSVFENIRSPLIGRHQLINMATTVGVAECLQSLGFVLSAEAVCKGFENIYWPGRFEIISKRPLIILDGAHNDASMRVLVETIQEVLPKRNVTVILGISSDKNRQAIAAELNPIVERVIATKANHPRAVNFTNEELAELFQGKECHRTECVEEALTLAQKRMKENDICLVTGSIFVVSEARKLCISSKV